MKEREITRESGPNDFFSFILERYLSGEQFEAYAWLNALPYGRQALIDLLKSEPIAESLESQWDRERGPDFPEKRTADTAVKEALIHVLSWERNKTFFYLSGDRDCLPDLSETEVIKRKGMLMVLIDYFNQVLPD